MTLFFLLFVLVLWLQRKLRYVTHIDVNINTYKSYLKQRNFLFVNCTAHLLRKKKNSKNENKKKNILSRTKREPKTQKLLEKKKSHEHIISGRNDKSNKFPFYLNKKFCLAIKNVGYVLEANCFKGNLFDFIVSLNHFRTVLFSCLLLLFTFIHNKC